MNYIYQHPDWPDFRWDNTQIQPRLDRVLYLQGWLIGIMESMGFGKNRETLMDNITRDVMNTSAIEGENLDIDQVRSSIARKLGIRIPEFSEPARSVEGIVSVLVDATFNHDAPLSAARLYNWHRNLFLEPYSGFHKITVVKWRLDQNGPMVVVSGAIGREKVHFQAPDAHLLDMEMDRFIQWFNHETSMNPVIKAAITGLWFVTLHPFEDGNGRIARALTDMMLSRSDMKKQRFYSMSAEIMERRKSYYHILEQTQKGSMDITHWLAWFLECMEASIIKSRNILEKTIRKARFWASMQHLSLNQRQTRMLDLLLDGFDGALTTTKWGKISKCSQDTAYRDILDLIEKNILEKGKGSGKKTHYQLKSVDQESDRVIVSDYMHQKE